MDLCTVTEVAKGHLVLQDRWQRIHKLKTSYKDGYYLPGKNTKNGVHLYASKEDWELAVRAKEIKRCLLAASSYLANALLAYEEK